MKKNLIKGSLIFTMIAQSALALDSQTNLNQRKISMQIEIEEQEINLNKAEVELLALNQQIELIENQNKISANVGKASVLTLGLGIASLILAVAQNTKATPGNHTAGYKALIAGMSSLGIGTVVAVGNLLYFKMNLEELKRLKDSLPKIQLRIYEEKLSLQNLKTAIAE